VTILQQTGEGVKISKPVKRQVLRDEIRDYLVDAIISGEFEAGERIIETRVAEDLGVSQAPVREALRDLELMGFVESAPYRGTTVCRPSLDEILAVYPVRAALEASAGRLSATRMTDEHYARLESELAAMIDAAERNDPHGQSVANIAFHQVILEASGNRTLLRLWQMMRLPNWTFVTAVLSGHNLVELARRHQVLIDALRTSDPNVAEEAMRRHIEQAAQWLAVSSGSEVSSSIHKK
jgi:DNA-binding GntR family transcriptional regulator